jgi:hypothetical protein
VENLAKTVLQTEQRPYQYAALPHMPWALLTPGTNSTQRSNAYYVTTATKSFAPNLKIS